MKATGNSTASETSLTASLDPSMSAAEVGRALRRFGVNLLCRQVTRLAQDLQTVLDFTAIRADDDYALLCGSSAIPDLVIQLHSDATYHSHPLPTLLPENGPRGAGLELRLFGIDPDLAADRARVVGWHILQPPADKPHGLRECYLIDGEGYCWVPGHAITG